MHECDEDRSVFNGHYEVEVVIDRPAAQVWTPLLDDTLWVTSHEVEVVSGELGKVGLITRVSAKTKSWVNTPPPHHHYCKLIKLIPERQYVLKTYTEKEGAYGMHMTAFDDTRLVPMGNKTKVIFNVYLEAKSEAITKDPSEMKTAMDVSREGMVTNLNNLKRIVEGR